MSRNLANRDPEAQAGTFARLLGRLKGAGAEAAAVTSMGGHFCIHELRAMSPLPLIEALPEVDAALALRGLERVGIIGTRMVMETKLYGATRAAEVMAPEGELMEQVHAAYTAMAIPGRVSDDERRVFFAAGRELHREDGAEAIRLGGTDLFLAFQGQQPGFPVIDCADIHVGAIFRHSSA
jgi:aspartate racemase